MCGRGSGSRASRTKEMTYGWLPGYSNEHFGLLHVDGAAGLHQTPPVSITRARRTAAAAAPPRVRHKASHHNNFFDAPFHFEEKKEEARTTFCSKIKLKMEAPPTAKFMSA